MSNRTLFTITLVMIACIGLLFLINFLPTFFSPINGKYLSGNGVKGMEVTHKKIPYTLNFDQQNKVIEWLNTSIQITSKEFPQKADNLPIEEMTIYRFDQPDIKLIPYGYLDENLVFQSNDWNAKGLMQEKSHGELKKLLSQTYDP